MTPTPHAIELLGKDSDPPGNDKVTVSVAPVAGTGPTQLGMFDISVTPKSQQDALINVQFIVQIEGQPPQAFSAFILIATSPALSAGSDYTATFFASSAAVTANRGGKALTVSVVGAVNTTPNVFFVSKVFTKNLWPS